MTKRVKSFIDTEQLSNSDVEQLFSQAKKIKANFSETGQFVAPSQLNPVVALLFFEASTRTRFSFDIASRRIGGQTVLFDLGAKAGTSVAKGESLEDTFWTVHAMRPDVIVVRSGESLDMKALATKTQVPLLNAGFGTHSHPTQALLDMFTMLESYPSLESKNILFVGDVLHSRVAHSHMRLLPRFGANVGVAGPKEFQQGLPEATPTFSNLKDALAWADVCVCLRVQFERHEEAQSFSQQDFIDAFQVRKEHQPYFKPGALLFHPGPVNWGIEMSEDVKDMPQFCMWQQKENGVYVRAALLQWILSQNGRQV